MRLARLILSISVLAIPIYAQSVATGAPPFATMQSVPEGQINLANLNVHIVIPIVHKAGVGIPFDYALSYDSAIWDSSSGSWRPAPDWGWRAVTEAAVGYITMVQNDNTCRYTLNGIQWYTENYTLWNQYAYHDPFGASHLSGAYARSDPGGHCGGSTVVNGTALDGSGYTLFPNGGSNPTAQAANGASIDAPVGSGASAGSVTDVNGNKISTSNGAAFTDTLAQTALSVAGSQSPGGSQTFTYSTAGGGQATVTVKYGSATVTTDFSGCSATPYSASNVPLVSEVDLPDGSKYLFTYTTDGRIASVTLPTGGQIGYGYSGGDGGITCGDGSTAALTRTMPDGTSKWTYAHSESSTAWTTLVTDPLGNQTNYQFQGIYQTERDSYSGAVGGSLLQSVITCYNGSSSPCNGTTITLPICDRQDRYGASVGGGDYL